MLLFDTSGIEAYVTENNPKYANRVIKQLKAYAKVNNFDDSYDPYKAAYASMPTSAASNHEVKQGSKSHLRSKLPTMKFVCPKMKWEYNREDKSKCRVCHCDNPCTTSSCGRMIYVYPEKNLRAYPGVECSSKEWDETYKVRVNVEKSIISKTASVLQIARQQTKKHFMQIYFSPEYHSY